jgi:hypothetical protein
MKTLLCSVLAVGPATAHAEKIALINGTMINPANNQILPDATVLIDGDRIVSEVAPPDS